MRPAVQSAHRNDIQTLNLSIKQEDEGQDVLTSAELHLLDKSLDNLIAALDRANKEARLTTKALKGQGKAR